MLLRRMGLRLGAMQGILDPRKYSIHILSAVCLFACARLEREVVLLLSCDLVFQEQTEDSYIYRSSRRFLATRT